MPISSPRIFRSAVVSRSLIVLPARLMDPPTMCPPLGSRFMIDRAVMVLPQPDSPTMPRVSPSSTCKVTPSTACTTPCLSWMWVRRSSISSSAVTWLAFLPLLQPGLERVAERVADEVERDARQDDRDARRVNQPPVVTALDVLEAAGQHRAPVGRRRLDTEAQEAEAGQGQDRVRDRERALHDDRADRVPEHVPDDRPHRHAADDPDRL